MAKQTVRLLHSRTLKMRFGICILETCSYGSNDCVNVYIQTSSGISHVVSMEISRNGHIFTQPYLGIHTAVAAIPLEDRANAPRV